MFTRGGVYRVVKEALGGTFAKLSVSALMFDYILTGPISGVSAGQYITGLLNELLVVGAAARLAARRPDRCARPSPFQLPMNSTSAVFAAVVTLYFWWQNIKGIEESSDKALRSHEDHHRHGGHPACSGASTPSSMSARTCRPAPAPSNLNFSPDALGFLKHIASATARCSASSASSWPSATPCWP